MLDEIMNVAFLNRDSLYWFCALVGTGLFIIQLGFSFAGFDGDEAISDALNVKWMSRQAVTGFLMMFGWTALTCMHEFGLSTLHVMLISLMMGGLAIFVVGTIFKFAKKLQSSGSVFNIHDIVGKKAFTYQKIPLNGVGKISISINDMTHEIDAMSQNKNEIPAFTHIKIINVLDTNTVIIEKI